MKEVLKILRISKAESSLLKDEIKGLKKEIEKIEVKIKKFKLKDTEDSQKKFKKLKNTLKHFQFILNRVNLNLYVTHTSRKNYYIVESEWMMTHLAFLKRKHISQTVGVTQCLSFTEALSAKEYSVDFS